MLSVLLLFDINVLSHRRHHWLIRVTRLPRREWEYRRIVSSYRRCFPSDKSCGTIQRLRLGHYWNRHLARSGCFSPSCKKVHDWTCPITHAKAPYFCHEDKWHASYASKVFTLIRLVWYAILSWVLQRNVTRWSSFNRRPDITGNLRSRQYDWLPSAEQSTTPQSQTWSPLKFTW